VDRVVEEPVDLLAVRLVGFDLEVGLFCLMAELFPTVLRSGSDVFEAPREVFF
jgi:hypothetical protein